MDAILLSTSDGKNILASNLAAQEMLGYGAEEILRLDRKCLIDPEDRKISLFLEKRGKSGQAKGELTFLRKDGSRIICEVSSTIFTNNAGQELSSTFIKDITALKKAEDKLKVSEERFRLLVDNAAEALFIHDLSGKFIDVNKQACESLGYTREELLHMGVFDIELDLDPESAQIEWSKIKIGEPFTLYGHQKRKDGSIFPIEARLATIDIAGKRLYMAMVRDITDRLKAEKIRAESEERYHSLFDNMLNGFAYCKMIFQENEPDDFIYLDVNKSFESLTGLKDVVGKKVSELIPGIKESDPELFEIYGRVALTGKPEVFETYLEALKMWFSISVYSPRKEYFVAVFDVVTKRKKAEEALKESESKYRGIFNESPSYLILLSKEGKLIDVNEIAVNFIGISKENLIGSHFSELKIISEDEISLHLEKIFRLLKGEKIEPFESKLIDKDGKTHYVKNYLNPLEKEGEIFAFQVIYNDITDLKLAEKEIKSSLREKEVLLREIHHRVKNNMQIISSLLNLQSYNVKEEETKDILKDSQGRIKAMSMVHEKLYQSSDLSHVNFKDYIKNVVYGLFSAYKIPNGLIQPIIQIDDVELNMETTIPLGLIINELVTNSLKFAFPDGKGSINITLKTNAHHHTLIVSDDGVGLSKDIEIEKTGTLGLKLVKSLVDQLDGTMELNLDKGTKFIIKFKEMEYKERLITMID